MQAPGERGQAPLHLQAQAEILFARGTLAQEQALSPLGFAQFYLPDIGKDTKKPQSGRSSTRRTSARCSSPARPS
jgi:hypothetical protein